MSEQTWACEAYGEDMPGPRHCFVELIERCTSQQQCHEQMPESRKQLFRRMQELAAHNPDDPVWGDLANEFKNPDELLGGNEGDSVDP